MNAKQTGFALVAALAMLSAQQALVGAQSPYATARVDRWST